MQCFVHRFGFGLEGNEKKAADKASHSKADLTAIYPLVYAVAAKYP
jgi:hypothetical protein